MRAPESQQGGQDGEGTVWPKQQAMRPGDEVPEGTPESAENVCRSCGGSGRVASGERCAECGGSGRVTEMLGDA